MSWVQLNGVLDVRRKIKVPTKLFTDGFKHLISEDRGRPAAPMQVSNFMPTDAVGNRRYFVDKPVRVNVDRITLPSSP